MQVQRKVGVDARPARSVRVVALAEERERGVDHVGPLGQVRQVEAEHTPQRLLMVGRFADDDQVAFAFGRYRSGCGPLAVYHSFG